MTERLVTFVRQQHVTIRIDGGAAKATAAVLEGWANWGYLGRSPLDDATALAKLDLIEPHSWQSDWKIEDEDARLD